MGPLLYMQSVVDQDVILRHVTVHQMVLSAWLSPQAGCTEIMTLSCILVL